MYYIMSFETRVCTLETTILHIIIAMHMLVVLVLSYYILYSSISTNGGTVKHKKHTKGEEQVMQGSNNLFMTSI